jgi:hypothetical protein
MEFPSKSKFVLSDSGVAAASDARVIRVFATTAKSSFHRSR